MTFDNMPNEYKKMLIICDKKYNLNSKIIQVKIGLNIFKV